MQKKLKFLFIMLILLSVFVHFSYATDIDPNALTSSFNTTVDNNTITNDVNNTTNTTNSTTNSISNSMNNSTTNTIKPVTQNTYSTPTVTSNSSLPEASLGFTNILSIVLIVVGLLLIFLAIAILIRLK